MKKIINKINEAIKSKAKLILFILIFVPVCMVFNYNSQTLNYYLKRGTILEYSIKQNQKIDEEKIDSMLLDLNIKYSYIKSTEEKSSEYLTDDGTKKLFISVPYIPKEDKTGLFNKVSDGIFKTYPDSKLISVKTLGNLYAKKYSALINFLIMFFTAFCIWIIIFNLFSQKNIFDEIKNGIVNFLTKQKNNIKELIENTKERGFGYFLKQIFLDNNENEENDSVTKEIISTIAFVLVAVVVIRFFIGELRWIPTESMYPTIKKRDRVYVEKLEYPKRTIERGDILVFYPPDVKLSNSIFAIFSRLTGIFCKDIAYIKRVVGMPGDKFEIKHLKDIDEYRVFINDEELREPYVNSVNNAGYEYPPKGYDGAWTPCSHPEVKYCGPFVIPEKKYFMMGDNRGNSADSRFWGFLDEDRVIGRAIFMFWPISRINPMRDKYLILDSEIKDGKKQQDRFIADRYSI